jgi:iron complex transport system substrate-binding protein
MTRALAPAVLMLLTACSEGAARPAPSGDGIVSLDYCADQMVLGLAERHRILGVSPEARSDESFAAPLARSIATVRPSLEAIAALGPRYAVRLYGGAPGIDRQLQRLGITVVQLNFSGSPADVPAETRRVARLLHAEARGEALAREFEAALAATQREGAEGAQRPRLLYMTPGDVTTGSDSFVGQIITASGFASVRTAPGWGSLPVEAMVRHPPDAVLRAFFDSARYRQDRWSAAAHPRLREIAGKLPSLDVPGSALACGNWLAGGALRDLVQLRQQLEQGR